MLGSAFSPYYAAARARGEAEPLDHCAMNVAVYSPRAHRWALTERGAGDVTREAGALSIGASEVRWSGDTLEARFDETTAPFPRLTPERLAGTIRLRPAIRWGVAQPLDAEGRHLWWPVAPCARVEVELSHPRLRWRGNGYLDANAGDEPLERSVQSWSWAHASSARGGGVVYDVKRRDGTRATIAQVFDRAGRVRELPTLHETEAARTRWGLRRTVHGDRGEAARLRRALEDTPFYCRSLIDASLLGERVTLMHESLSLDRLQSRWVRFLLPFRMRRAEQR